MDAAQRMQCDAAVEDDVPTHFVWPIYAFRATGELGGVACSKPRQRMIFVKLGQLPLPKWLTSPTSPLLPPRAKWRHFAAGYRRMQMERAHSFCAQTQCGACASSMSGTYSPVNWEDARVLLGTSQSEGWIGLVTMVIMTSSPGFCQFWPPEG